MRYQPESVLITGGAGFIGTNFIEFMFTAHPKVKLVNLDAMTYAATHKAADFTGKGHNYTFARGDICDRELVDQLLRAHRIDTIIHFAAESHVDRSIAGPGAFIQTNFVGTFTLLEAARQYWIEARTLDRPVRMHHISTDEVYGSLSVSDPPFNEQSQYAPNSPYSASKAGSDHLVRAYFHTYGLPVITTNCSNNYGAYQNGEKFIPTVIRSCLEQQPIPVYGDGSNIRDWLYVADHCAGIYTVLSDGKPGETYNIGGENERANIDIVKDICAIMDQHFPQHAPHDRLITYVTDRPGHDWRYAIDPHKVENELGWRPAETFATGIVKTINWYLDNDYKKLSNRE